MWGVWHSPWCGHFDMGGCVMQKMSWGLRLIALLIALNAPLWQGSASAQLPKPRIIIISDIGNEPDDQMSLVRYLTYSNQVDTEGLIACTSTWLRDTTNPQMMHSVIAAYGKVRDNLMQHEKGWPTQAALDALVTSGQTGYGMAATGTDKMSAGAQEIIAAADRDDPRPLWITLWGGANTLAQALLHVRETRTAAQVDKFVAKLRVSSISDQDDAGLWMRREFPKLFYIVKPSPPNGEEYQSATWTGISGDLYYRMPGADTSLVTNEWLDKNIRSKGALGAHYPKFLFIMEGDTPSYLGLIPNGLNSEKSPNWGGWGGRYVYRQPYGETHEIWSQGGDLFSRATSADTVRGVDGAEYTTDHATIWRWRQAFQNDFAARMDWSVQDYAHANHPPVVVVNGDSSGAPIAMSVQVGDIITLDAAASHDPDGDKLSYHWFHYKEAGAGKGIELAQVELAGADSARATVTAHAACRAPWLAQYAQCSGSGVAHIIVAVTDNGTPALTRYRRVVLTVKEKAK
jgi:Protein of unknown function (DUF1593)